MNCPSSLRPTAGWTLALAACCLLAGCKPAPRDAQKLVVRYATAVSFDTGAVSAGSAYLAMVRGQDEIELSFKVGGILELIGPRPAFDWQEGTAVKREAVLARLVQTDFVSAVHSARAKAELDQKTFERNQKLRADGAISQQEFDLSEAAAKTSAATLAQAEQALRESVLVAPFDGQILARMANSGETIAAGKPVLRFADLRQMSVELGVPDRLIGRIRVGQHIPVTISALEGRTFPGTVTEVSVAAPEGTRLFKVKIQLDNPDGLLKSGMTASVPLEERAPLGPQAVLVPLSALVASAKNGAAGQLAVFVVGEDGHARERIVKPDDIVASSIIVKEGLQAGEKVVVVGASNLYDGAPVDARAQ
jgi:RND family efflux transporter MFP subunit